MNQQHLMCSCPNSAFTGKKDYSKEVGEDYLKALRRKVETDHINIEEADFETEILGVDWV